MHFHIGDRVRSNRSNYGTVVAVSNRLIGVDFDDWSYGHNLDGRLSGDHVNHGYWMFSDELDLVDDLDNYNPPGFSLLI